MAKALSFPALLMCIWPYPPLYLFISNSCAFFREKKDVDNAALKGMNFRENKEVFAIGTRGGSGCSKSEQRLNQIVQGDSRR